MTEPTSALSLTEKESSILLGALAAKTVETRAYLSSYDDAAIEPAATDLCCAAHRHRFEQRQDQRDALIERHAAVAELNQKVEDATSAIVLSHHQLSNWAGQTLSPEEIDRLAAALEHSSVPEAIATIVASFED